ncbi:RDD family protein [Ideonella sp.]|uniref:RDD family protein n=1 Tax=Ideonella sp. TaxID=1929293 RepID=UPI0035B1F943
MSGVAPGAGAAGPAPTSSRWPAPSLARRLAAFLYEGVLLFGVLMVAGGLYSVTTGMRHALQGQAGLQAFLFAVLGLYFVWFWTHGGQTVAMKAWHVRLVDAHGRAVGRGRALVRYLLAWLWFVPALAAAHLAGLQGGGSVYGLLAVGVLVYAALSLLHPERQFWHDVACGTRLVDARQHPVPRPAPR